MRYKTTSKPVIRRRSTTLWPRLASRVEELRTRRLTLLRQGLAGRSFVSSSATAQNSQDQPEGVVQQALPVGEGLAGCAFSRGWRSQARKPSRFQ